MHDPDVVAAAPRGLGVHLAAHFAEVEEGRLLVHERDQFQGPLRLERPQRPRNLDQTGHAARIVVRPRASGDGVVVRAGDDDLARASGSRDGHLEVVAAHAMGHIGLRSDGIAERRQFGVDVVGRRAKRPRPPDIALADLAGEHVHVTPQPAFEGRQPLNLPGRGAAGDARRSVDQLSRGVIEGKPSAVVADKGEVAD